MLARTAAETECRSALSTAETECRSALSTTETEATAACSTTETELSDVVRALMLALTCEIDSEYWVLSAEMLVTWAHRTETVCEIRAMSAVLALIDSEYLVVRAETDARVVVAPANRLSSAWVTVTGPVIDGKVASTVALISRRWSSAVDRSAAPSG